MSKKKICMIAQFPPPIHGLSKAADTLYKSEKINEQYDLIKVDITDNKKFLLNCKTIAKTEADLFYFTISQSIGGNIRDLLILYLLRKQGKKCLIHLHGGYYRKLYEEKMKEFQRRWNRNALNSIDGVIVLGNSLRNIFEGLVNDSKIYVVPNCVDDEFLISEKELREKHKNYKGTYNILYLSNFIRPKGYDVVLEMAKEYKKNPGDKRLHFDFAGKFYTDEDKSFFENYIRDYDLNSVVTYHGIVSGDAKRELLRKSTFFALPTKYPKEGQPISILEAMGNGLVILTTNHAGIPDVVQNGVNGCMLDCKKKDKAKLFLGYIEKLDDISIETITENNFREIKEHYLENTYVSNIEKCFSVTIKGE